jgi:hypothetical protein
MNILYRLIQLLLVLMVLLVFLGNYQPAAEWVCSTLSFVNCHEV